MSQLRDTVLAGRLRLVPLGLALAVALPAATGSTSGALATRGAAREFFARTSNGTASCAIYNHFAGSTEAFCESIRPGRESKATVNARGKVSICVSKNTRSDHCGLGNAGDNTPTFGAGRKVTLGRFSCTIRREGVRCIVVSTGKGFLFNPSKALRVGPR